MRTFGELLIVAALFVAAGASLWVLNWFLTSGDAPTIYDDLSLAAGGRECSSEVLRLRTDGIFSDSPQISKLTYSAQAPSFVSFHVDKFFQGGAGNSRIDVNYCVSASQDAPQGEHDVVVGFKAIDYGGHEFGSPVNINELRVRVSIAE